MFLPLQPADKILWASVSWKPLSCKMISQLFEITYLKSKIFLNVLHKTVISNSILWKHLIIWFSIRNSVLLTTKYIKATNSSRTTSISDDGQSTVSDRWGAKNESDGRKVLWEPIDSSHSFCEDGITRQTTCSKHWGNRMAFSQANLHTDILLYADPI